MDIVKKLDIILEQFKVVNEKKSNDEYEELFKKLLKKYKVKEPDELSDKQKKKFFNEIDSLWKSKKEKKNG